MSRPTLLLPVVFPDPACYPVSDTFVEEFSGFDVVLFGYWEVPPETDIDAFRDQHQIEADAVLYELAAAFSHAGAQTEIELHFGSAGDDELRDEITQQTRADAIFVPKPFTSLGKVLAPIRDARNQPRLVEVVGALNENTVIDIELFHVCSDPSEEHDADEMLAEVRESLLDQGFPGLEVETTVEVNEDPGYAIAQRARRHDLVIMGATDEPDFEDKVFGPVYEYVADRSEDPILVVHESDT